jgi:ankyrin repeat protein
MSIYKGMSLDVVRCLVKDLGADVNGAMLGTRGATALFLAAKQGNMAVVQCLVKELGANVNQARISGAAPLHVAAENDHLAVVRCLVKEFGADVNHANRNGATPLYIAAQEGNLAVVRCMVKELGADVNKGKHDGASPLMIAATKKHEGVVAFLIKYGANAQFSAFGFGTAADQSKIGGASAAQTQYIEARAHCAKPGCVGQGIKKCAGCLKVYYCARECQLAHWSAHKADCRQSADLTTGKEK